METFASFSEDNEIPASEYLSSYRLINTKALQDLVDALSPSCKLCGVKDRLLVNESTVYGLASKLEVVCKNCQNIVYTGNTSPIVQDGKSRDINNRYVLAC